MRLDKKVSRHQEKYDSYKNKNCKGANQCINVIEKSKKEIDETKVQFEKVLSRFNREMSEVSGWYFYSDKKIEQLVGYLIAILSKEEKPDSYTKVIQILIGPEEYLGRTRVFNVE